MSLPTQRTLVPVTGGSLAVFRYGEGVGDPVLLIHGVTSSNRAFQLFADELIVRGKAVYAVDLRGRGDSNTLPEPFGMAQHAHDMAAVIEFLQLKKPDVIGHSMGGFVAAALHELFPNLVNEIVFVDGGLPLPPPAGVSLEQAMPFIMEYIRKRLLTEYESKEAYREFWRSHPACVDGWELVLNEYADYDLRGIAPHMRPASNLLAVEADIREEYGHELNVRALKGLKKKSLLIKTERGLFNEEHGVYPMAWLEQILPEYPMIKLEYLANYNHYEIMLEQSGAEKVAQIIYGDRL
ncbi:MAG: alpha/beta hydrolase [Candidatus Planktophila sp.]|nr:alpha/beta hydrolase [Candidatus Planktophila sp.]